MNLKKLLMQYLQGVGGRLNNQVVTPLMQNLVDQNYGVPQVQAAPLPTPTQMPSPTPMMTPRPTPTPMSPTPTPQIISPLPDATPTPAPKPQYATPQIQNQMPQGFQFDPKTVGINIPSQYKFQQPTGEMAKGIYNAFPNNATQSAVTAWSENAAHPYDLKAAGWNDPNSSKTTPGFGGTFDKGPFQINEKTLQDFLKRYPAQMKLIGADAPDAVNDPIKAPLIAAMIYAHQGWKAWKGWQNKGVTGL